MLHTKIKAPEPSGSEVENRFEYFAMYFCGSNTGPLA